MLSNFVKHHLCRADCSSLKSPELSQIFDSCASLCKISPSFVWRLIEILYLWVRKTFVIWNIRTSHHAEHQVNFLTLTICPEWSQIKVFNSFVVDWMFDPSVMKWKSCHYFCLFHFNIYFQNMTWLILIGLGNKMIVIIFHYDFFGFILFLIHYGYRYICFRIFLFFFRSATRL